MPWQQILNSASLPKRGTDVIMSAYFRFPFLVLLAWERLVLDDRPDAEEPSYLLATEAISVSIRSISLEVPGSWLFGRPFFELP